MVNRKDGLNLSPIKFKSSTILTDLPKNKKTEIDKK